MHRRMKVSADLVASEDYRRAYVACRCGGESERRSDIYEESIFVPDKAAGTLARLSP